MTSSLVVDGSAVSLSVIPCTVTSSVPRRAGMDEMCSSDVIIVSPSVDTPLACVVDSVGTSLSFVSVAPASTVVSVVSASCSVECPAVVVIDTVGSDDVLWSSVYPKLSVESGASSVCSGLPAVAVVDHTDELFPFVTSPEVGCSVEVVHPAVNS